MSWLSQLIGCQSGLTLFGVVTSTIYRLFDLDYNIFVIRDNVVELPVDQTAEITRVMLDAVVPKCTRKQSLLRRRCRHWDDPRLTWEVIRLILCHPRN